MRAVKSFFIWLWVGFTGMRTVMGGIIRIPFGKARDYYRHAGYKFGRTMLKAVGATGTWDGLENIDPSKSYIFVGNHQSYADIFILQIALGQLGMNTLFMAKKELRKLPLFSVVIKYMGLIPVEKGESRGALKIMIDSIKELEKGSSLTIFAEGTRSKDGEIQPFLKGAFLLASKTGIPIIPFAITGTIDIMSTNDLHINRGKSCHISFMPPIDPAEEKLSVKELSEKVEGLIRERYEQIRKK